MLFRLVGPARHRHRTLAALSASMSSSSNSMSSGGQHLRFSQSDEEEGQQERGHGSKGRGGGGGEGRNRGRRGRGGGGRGSGGRFQHAQQHQWRGGGGGGWRSGSTSSSPPQWRTGGGGGGGGGGGQGGYGYHQQHHHQHHQPQHQQPPQPRRNDLARFRRPWIKLKDYYGLQQQQEEHSAAHPQTMPPTFTLLSWNVLADSLVDREGYLGYATEEELDWRQRGPRVHETLRRSGADVVCLQEDDHHEEAQAALGSEYEGVFKKRTGPEKRDGCSIFWNTRRFRLVCTEEVEYHVPGTQHLDRDNVGVIVVLEDLAVPAVEREEERGGKRRGGGRRKAKAASASSEGEGEGEEGKGKRRRRLLVVANTHLLFNPRRGDVKLAQVQMLLRRLEALMAELQPPPSSSSSAAAAAARTKEEEGNDVAVGLVLAGDFNSTPLSAIYHLLSAGELDTRSLNRSWVAGQGRGLMLRSGPHRNMMPYSELAPPSASLSDPHHPQQPGGEEGEGEGRGIRTYRHFGAGTARGVFRPHVRREGAAADMEMEEEMRSVARENGLGDSSEGKEEEEEEGMDVVPGTPVELPAHVPRPLWRHPEEWSMEDNGGPIRHALGLQSAYAHRPAAYTTGEPAFTTFHAEFKGTVDYVWLTRETLRCSAILGMPTLGELASQEGLPCVANPSDHLPLLTKLRFRL